MLRFSADEIYEMAQAMEQRGIEFYSRAARRTSGSNLGSLFANLARMEQGHLEAFTELRNALPPEDRRRDVPVEPEDVEEREHYIRTLVHSHVFGPEQEAWLSSRNDLSPSEVLAWAEEIEKDSIVFLLELQELVPAHRGRQDIDRILREELRHLRMLHARQQAE